MLYTLRGVEDEAGLTDEPPLFAGGEVGFRLLPDVVSTNFLAFLKNDFILSPVFMALRTAGPPPVVPLQNYLF